MVQETAVSVIIPSLNTAHYIKECLESILHQTLRNIEVICVDAFSTDGTREIIAGYVQKDSRIKVLNDTRASTGFAKNYGIQKAKGKYIAIVEPDDYVALNMYETLFAEAEKAKADIVKTDFEVFFGDDSNREFVKRGVARAEQYREVLNPKLEKNLFINEMSTWTGIYNKDFLMKNKVQHNETPGAAFQDNGFWFNSMAAANTVVYLQSPGYKYRLDNPNSSIHNKEKVFAICDEYDFIERFLRDKGWYKEFSGIFVYIKFVRYLYSYHRIRDTYRRDFAKRFHNEMLLHKEDGTMDVKYFSIQQLDRLNEILDGAEVFQNKIKEQYTKLEEVISNGKPLIQCGFGGDGIRFLTYAKENKFMERIVCIADNNKDLAESSIWGISIGSLKVAVDKYPDGHFIITSINYENQIYEQLRKLGIAEKEITIMNIV